MISQAVQAIVKEIIVRVSTLTELMAIVFLLWQLPSCGDIGVQRTGLVLYNRFGLSR